MTSDDDKPLTPQQARQKLQKGLRDYLAGIDTGPIVFRLKRTKKASETYPLKLTQLQRETLLQFTQINRTLKRKIKEAGEGTQIVGVTWNELHTLNDATGEAAVYASSVHEKRLMAVQARVVKFFEEEHAEVFGWMSPKTRKPRLTKSEHLYQFKFTLLETSPPIWRRIQVRGLHPRQAPRAHPDGDGLDQLPPAPVHDRWQALRRPYLDGGGLRGERIRGFHHDNVERNPPWERQAVPLRVRVRLRRRLAARGHFEGRLKGRNGEALPALSGRGRACPPEDVGGVTGYADFLEAIADPENEEHDGFLEWAGGRFDPEEFNPVVATRRMKQGLPDWRSMR